MVVVNGKFKKSLQNRVLCAVLTVEDFLIYSLLGT